MMISYAKVSTKRTEYTIQGLSFKRWN